MAEEEWDGYGSPEEAARGDIPERFCTIVGVDVNDEEANVWMLTNDRPPYEPYEMHCVRQGDCWYASVGSGGFSNDAPAEVVERARAMGWQSSPKQ